MLWTVADSGSEKVFGGSMASFSFGQLASSNVGKSSAVFGSVSITGVLPSSSAAASSAGSSSVFGSGTKVVGFADLAASGSGAGDVDNKSG